MEVWGKLKIKDYEQIMKDKFKLVIYVAMGLLMISSFYDVKWFENLVNSNLTWITISIITTGFCQLLIQKISGDFFEKIPLTMKIGKFKFSFSLFIVVTVVLKFFLFRGI